MKAAILNPGPSLPITWDDDDFEGYVICVNRAATKYPCETWACGDWPAVELNSAEVIGSPILLAASDGLEKIVKHGHPWRGKTVSFESLFDYCHPGHSKTGWTLVTSTAAIIYAASIGATEIEVYGADWKGTLDWDSVEAGGNRSPERWLLESQYFAAVQRELKGRGITVHRVVPPGAETFESRLDAIDPTIALPQVQHQ